MTDFDRALQARIDEIADMAQREITFFAKRSNEEISRLVSHHIRSMGKSRRFWNEKNRKGVRI